MPTVKKSQPTAGILPSERKLRSLRALSALGLKVSDGYDYGLHEALVETDIKKTRKALSAITTSMSEDVVRDRDDD